jgi:hypothetical protein
MTRNYFADSCIALVLGTGAGMILSVFGQKMINQHYKNTCHEKPGHNLVLTRGFLGDTYFCINSKYIVSP